MWEGKAGNTTWTLLPGSIKTGGFSRLQCSTVYHRGPSHLMPPGSPGVLWAECTSIPCTSPRSGLSSCSHQALASRCFPAPGWGFLCSISDGTAGERRSGEWGHPCSGKGVQLEVSGGRTNGLHAVSAEGASAWAWGPTVRGGTGLRAQACYACLLPMEHEEACWSASGIFPSGDTGLCTRRVTCMNGQGCR